MNQLKYYSLYTIALILLMTACRKESSIVGGEFTETDTTELDAVLFQGQITNREGTGIESTIDLYQNEQLVGSIQTDANGNYLSENLFIEPDVEVTFDIYRDGYKHKYRRLVRGLGLHSNLNFSLLSIEDAIGGPDQIVTNPGSEEYIKVYRTILDVLGNPVPNIFSTVTYDHELIGPNAIYTKGGFDVTDENGYMEVLVPRGEEFFHLAAPYFDDPNIECTSTYIYQDTTLLLPFVSRQSLGVLTEDYEIDNYPNIVVKPTPYSVSGRLLNCDGTPVQSGTATIVVTYGSGTFPNAMSFSTTDIDANGNYQIDFEVCTYGEYSGRITGMNDQGDIGAVLFTGALGEQTLPDLYTCNQLPSDDSYMNLAIGSIKTLDSIRFTQSVVTETAILAFGSHPDHGNMSLSVKDLQLGLNPIEVLNLNWITEQPYGFSALNGELTLDVQSIENDYITGTISGSTETNEFGVQEIIGELYIQYQ